MCSRTSTKYRRHDRSDYHQNALERPISLDPNECRNRIRFLNATDNIELNHFNYNHSFTFFDDPAFQKRLETVQPHFKTNILNAPTFGTFTYPTTSDWLPDPSKGLESKCRDKHKYYIIKHSWRLIIREIELTFDDKENTLIYNGHTLPCLHDDGFCQPTIITPFTIVWFPQDLCLIFSIHHFIGRMS